METHLNQRARRAIAAAGIGFLAAALAAACGASGGVATVEGSGRAAPPAPESPSSALAAPSTGGATPAGETSGAKGSSDAKGRSDAKGTSRANAPHRAEVPRCRTDQLRMDLGGPKPAAGNRYASLVFTNDSGRTCALFGYPGVTVLNGEKEQIGPDAERAPSNTVRQVKLSPGESANAQLHWASRVGGQCRPTSKYLRAFPPGATEAIIIPTDIRLCGDTFFVQAVTPSTDGAT